MISDDRLDALIAELPEAVEPGRDLWPEIEAALEPGVSPGTPPRRRWLLAVAAALLVGLLAGGLAVRLAVPGYRGEPEPTRAPEVRAERDWRADLALADAELARALEARRGVLDPEVLAVIERNIEVIDIALADTAAALDADPDNARLEVALADVWRRRIALLEHARELHGGS